MEKKTTTQK